MTATCGHRITVNGIVYGDEIMGDEVPCGRPASFLVDPELRLRKPDEPPHYVCGAHAKVYGNDLIKIPR